MVQLIFKLFDKLFTLLAFVSAVCLAVHFLPLHCGDIVNNLADFWSFVMQIIFCIALIVTAVLLLLDLFSAKFKLVQNKVWIYFAAIGILPCIPLALFGAFILGNVLLGGLWR